LKQKKNK